LFAFISGKYLENLDEDVLELDERLPIKSFGFLSVRQALLHLRSEDNVEEKNLAELKGDLFDCHNCFDESVAPVDVAKSIAQCFFIAYLFYDYALARRFVQRCRPLTNLIAPTYQYPVYLFYSSLVSLAIARNTDEGIERDNLITEAKESLSKLKSMSDVAPCNFSNKVKLIEAEMQITLGDNSKALEQYDEAISLSKKYGFVQEEALASERAGLYLLQQNKVDDAYEYLVQAHYSYKAWGAISKTKQLIHSYPLISEKMKKSRSKRKYPAITDNQLEVDDHSLASVSLLTNGSLCTFKSSYLKEKRVKFS